jgi:Chalcone isomerase-like
MRALQSALMLVAASWIGAAQAVEVAGAKLPDGVRVSAGGPELILNGAGLRTRFFVKVYAAGLYVEKKTPTAAGVLALKGPKRVSMHLLRSISAKQILDALHDGIDANNSPAEREKLKTELGELDVVMTQLGPIKEGDIVTLDYVPGTGTVVTVNGQAKGKAIAGEALYQALLRVWLGDDPVQDDLKKELLGQPS